MITYITLTSDDAGRVHDLMMLVIKELPDKRWYVPSTEAELKRLMSVGYSIGAETDDGMLVGAAICQAGDSGYGEKYAVTAGEPSGKGTMDFTDVMVHPDYRRNGIHTHFMKDIYGMAVRTGAHAVYATADPLNIPSRSSFESFGYRKVLERDMYDGRPRVLYKLDID